jgi:hypothetical protein
MHTESINLKLYYKIRSSGIYHPILISELFFERNNKLEFGIVRSPGKWDYITDV